MKFNGKFELGMNVAIGENVKIGDRTVICDNAVIGDNTIIANDCVIGEPLAAYYSQNYYENLPTIIGSDCLIRSHTIIYSDTVIGDYCSTGHRVTIREKTNLGSHCRVGTLSDIQGYSNFGDYCWLHSSVHIGQQSMVGSFVFIYPYVVFTNDPHPPSDVCVGPTVGDFTQIAVGAILLPDIRIGEHVLIGANSVVGQDVEDFQLVVGNPAKAIKDVRQLKSSRTGESHYPWPRNFDRGMPWQGIGFDAWARERK